MLQLKMKLHWGKIVKGVITIGLMIAFTYFVQDVVIKYRKQETNLKQTTQSFDEFKIPVVTMCFYPPFKPRMKAKYNISKDLFYAVIDSSDTIDSMSEFFDYSIYKLGTDFKLYVSNAKYDQVEIKLGTNNVPIADNSWKAFDVGKIYSSMHGLCYFIEPKYTIKPKEFGSTLFGMIISDSLPNDERPSRVTFGLTIKNNSFGAIEGSWMEGDPLEADMSLKADSDSIMKSFYLLEYQYRLLSDPPNCNPSNTYYQCIAEKVFFNEDWFNNCPRKCLPIIYTTLKELASNETIPFCETKEENRCVALKIWFQLSYLSKTCKRGCHMVQYKGRIQSYERIWNNTNAEIYFSFNTPTTMIIEEYLLYDFVGILGSVGGSLGLFLGFSFLGLFSDLIDFLQSKLNKIQEHYP